MSNGSVGGQTVKTSKLVTVDTWCYWFYRKSDCSCRGLRAREVTWAAFLLDNNKYFVETCSNYRLSFHLAFNHCELRFLSSLSLPLSSSSVQADCSIKSLHSPGSVLSPHLSLFHFITFTCTATAWAAFTLAIRRSHTVTTFTSRVTKLQTANS